MRKLTVAFFFAYLIGALAIFGNAQTAGGSAVSNESDEDGKVVSRYDKAKNETKVTLIMLQIDNTAPQNIVLSMSATFEGEKPKKNPDVFFIFQIISPDGYKYPNAMRMKVSADGKKLDDIIMLTIGKAPLEENFLETIATVMKYDVFQRLAQAKNVEMQLESTKFQLTETITKKLAEFAAAVSAK